MSPHPPRRVRDLVRRFAPRADRFAWGSAGLLGLLASLGLSADARSQLAVSRTDGRLLHGEPIGTTGGGAETNLRLRLADGEERTVPLASVLGLHGPPPREAGGAVAHLVGGDRLRGELGPGDEAGESFTIRSPTLGLRRVPIDRLQVLLFSERAGEAEPGDFALPEGAEDDEALFRPASRGFEAMLGAIHRFADEGVVFEWAITGEPREFAFDELAAVALRGGEPPRDRADARLVTRSGDVVHGRVGGIADGRLEMVAEGETKIVLPLGEVSALTFLGADRVFLSDLEPVAVEERGSHLEEGGPLYGWRRDRGVTGGALVVGGLTWGKGLGTHARWAGTWRVPGGFGRLHARVGIDDSVRQTRVRGDATVRVRVDGEVVFGPVSVRGGQAPATVGPLPVAEGAEVTLEADFGEGWFLGDRVDWLGAVLLR